MIESAVERRRREFTAGRLLAREVLDRLGVANYPLLSGASRQPLWPRGIAGSITHTEGYCAVVAARCGDLASLGIDAEPAAALDGELWDAVLVEREQQWLMRQPEASRGTLATLIFSAKECGFKAQFPVTGAFVDFREAAVTLDLDGDANGGGFRIELLADAGAQLPRGSSLRGRLLRRGGLWMTGLALSPSDLALG